VKPVQNALLIYRTNFIFSNTKINENLLVMQQNRILIQISTRGTKGEIFIRKL